MTKTDQKVHNTMRRVTVVYKSLPYAAEKRVKGHKKFDGGKPATRGKVRRAEVVGLFSDECRRGAPRPCF